MTKVSYLEALENPNCRQEYLNFLVESSGLNFPYVDDFMYISKKEAIKIKDRICRISEDSENELEKMTAVCTPNGTLPANSTIYFTENNFSDYCKKLLCNSIVAENDFEIAQRIEICYHEAVHSEYFGKGIEGFDLEEFKLNTEEGKMLFLIASELGAHAIHIKELGKIKINSHFLREYQKFMITEFISYIKLLPQLVKIGYDEKLSKKIFNKYNNLEYSSL
ncbi:MAG: hypothetical protein AABW83_01515 [Nanoarchaeota archaeon]